MVFINLFLCLAFYEEKNMINLACIISVLNESQNLKNIEKNLSLNRGCLNFYIIDGGSTDGSYEYLDSISDFYSFKLFRNDNDAGIYDSWNKCLDFVIEDYVCFCGADDLLNPEFAISVSNSLKFLFQPNQYPDVFYGDAIFFLSGIFKYLKPSNPSSILNVNKFNRSISFDLFHPGLYMRLDVLKVKFDCCLKLAGDLDLFLKIYFDGRILFAHYIPIEQATISYNGVSTKVSKYKIYMKEFKYIEKKYDVIIKKNRFKFVLSYLKGIDTIYSILRKIKWYFL